MKSGTFSWVRIFALVTIGVGIGVGAMLWNAHTQQATAQNCIKKYSLTSHTLDCADYEDSAARLSALDAKFDDAVALYIKQGKATRVSVWVRDLETKQWASTNELDTFAPASLLKLPLMVAYYKVAEIQPTLLDTQLTYTQQSSDLNDSSQDFKPQDPLILGQSYSVEQLIKHMIIDSDNNATALLLTHLDASIFDNTMIDLGIKVPGNNKTYDFVTAKTYATIFRTLYSASYLNRDYSEKALELLSQSTFKGIADSVPSTVTVAHKFGEREIDDTLGGVATRELHDCGIVYKEGTNPYSLCIMAEGKNFDDLLTIIHDLSALTYQQL